MADVKQLPVRLDSAAYEQLRALSYVTGVPMNRIIGLALESFMAGPGRTELVNAAGENARTRHREILDKLAAV
jgi:hypothetical protein